MKLGLMVQCCTKNLMLLYTRTKCQFAQEVSRVQFLSDLISNHFATSGVDAEGEKKYTECRGRIAALATTVWVFLYSPHKKIEQSLKLKFILGDLLTALEEENKMKGTKYNVVFISGLTLALWRRLA